MEHSKTAISVVIIAFVILFGLLLLPANKGEQQVRADSFLRIHIRANSNSAEDQAVKYKVKDKVVQALTPLLANAGTKQEAIKIVSENINYLQSVANDELKANGFSYGCKGEIRNEKFPTRTYDTLTLESGNYDALILELGTGSGDNWWCVAYPPLCFVNYDQDSSTQLIYRSKLVEIIEKFFNKG